MLEVKHTAVVSVTACEPSIGEDGKPKTAKVGEQTLPVFDILIATTQRKMFGGKLVEMPDVDKLTSIIKLEPGKYEVELQQFSISAGKNVNNYYRVVKATAVAKK